MRTRFILIAAAALAAFGPAYAGDPPPDAVIIGMTHRFVLKHFKPPAEGQLDTDFEMTEIHPQPGGDFWAVLGAFRAAAGDKKYEPHGYGAALRLICADHGKAECWRLEKLIIDRAVIVNLDPPG